MLIACLGDSLTEGDYGVFGKSGIANVKEINYPYFLSQLLNTEVRNYGKCGYNSTSYLSYYIDGNVNLDNVDVIIVMLGTNGGLSPDDDTQGNADYRKLIELCRTDVPKAKIIVCTPPHATENPEFSNCGYAPQVENAVKFVRNYAENENALMIDTALCPDFTAENEHVMQPNDGLHFGEAGYKKLAEYIAAELKKLLNI